MGDCHKYKLVRRSPLYPVIHSDLDLRPEWVAVVTKDVSSNDRFHKLINDKLFIIYLIEMHYN